MGTAATMAPPWPMTPVSWVMSGMRRGELVALRWRDVDFRLHKLAVSRSVSADIEHEVLPATQPRRSIAGWFRRRP